MDRWTEVLPWCKHLRGRLQLEESERPQSAQRVYSWLQLSLPKHRRSASAEQLRQIREAFELLAIVAAADSVAYKLLLREQCGVRYTDDGSGVPPLRVILVLDDHTKESILWPASICNKFFGLLHPFEHSDDYVETKSALLGTAAVLRPDMKIGDGDRASISVPRIPFCLHFAPKRMGLASLTQYLQSVLKVIQVLLNQTGRPPLNGIQCDSSGDDGDGGEPDSGSLPFVLSAIQLDLSDFELNESVANVLQAIAATGVNISCLQLPLCATDFLTDEECPRQPLASCLQTILSSDSTAFLMSTSKGEDSLPTAIPGGVETLVVHGRNIDDRRFAALCSTLVESRSVRELVLESVFTQDSFAARAIKWKWLAYALLSNTAMPASTIHKLTISESQLLMSDVEAFESVLRATHPAGELVDPLWSPENQEHSARDDSSTHVELTTGTIIYMEPVLYPEDWMNTTVVLQHDASFPIINNDPESEWIDVLVPGYGKCWVHEDTATTKACRHSSIPDNDDQDLAQLRVSSLALAIDVDENGGDDILERFFQLIGPSLVEVCLHVNVVLEQGVNAIFRACPSMKRLELRGAEMDSMDAFVQAYDDGTCRLASLTLTNFHIDLPSVSRFAHALSDLSTNAARCLKELSIGLVRTEDGTIDDGSKEYHTMIDDMLSMLDANNTLEYFELHLETAMYDQYASKFERHHNGLLPWTSDEPIYLPTRACLSLISVLNSYQVAGSPFKPDDDAGNNGANGATITILKRICRFASSPSPRVVRIIECVM